MLEGWTVALDWQVRRVSGTALDHGVYKQWWLEEANHHTHNTNKAKMKFLVSLPMFGFVVLSQTWQLFFVFLL